MIEMYDVYSSLLKGERGGAGRGSAGGGPQDGSRDYKQLFLTPGTATTNRRQH